MSLPKVAIVGRPNVGKSSLFNWLIGRRVAIVDPTSGVTRDRVAEILRLGERMIELVDTGGMGVEDKDGLTRQIEAQITAALEEASVILFVLDAHTGITELDRHVARRLARRDKPILSVINKCDSDSHVDQARADCARFGFPVLFCSTTANRNRAELQAAIAGALPEQATDAPAHVVMKIAVVGKRNAGKSTFINVLANSERVIVSEVPGTTRDSIDVRFEHHGQAFIAIDTAGVRKMKSLADSIEFYSFTRAQRTIRRADVVLLFLDASTSIGKVEKQLASFIVESHKPCIFVVNKWDLLLPRPTSEFDEYLTSSLPDLAYAPRAFLTARTGKNAQAVIDLAQALFHQATTRVSTGELNRIVHEATRQHPPPTRHNRAGRIYYASQVAVAPPTILLFCNSPSLFSNNYRRYLLGFLRDRLPFAEIPIKLAWRRRGGAGEESDTKAATTSSDEPGDDDVSLD